MMAISHPQSVHDIGGGFKQRSVDGMVHLTDVLIFRCILNPATQHAYPDLGPFRDLKNIMWAFIGQCHLVLPFAE